jgi:hypothetical protein
MAQLKTDEKRGKVYVDHHIARKVYCFRKKKAETVSGLFYHPPAGRRDELATEEASMTALVKQIGNSVLFCQRITCLIQR